MKTNGALISVLKKIYRKITGSKRESPESIKAAEESMQHILQAFEILSQKAVGLKEKYPEQAKLIEEYYEETKSIEPSASVRAGKFEQALAQEITKVSSSCDKIFESGDTSILDENLKYLARFIRERKNADIPEEE